MIVGAYARIFEELDEAFTALARERGTHEPVYLNAHQAPSSIPPGAIVYNMENVGVQIPPSLFAGCTVWDMSERNVALWRKHGREAVHVPLGYHAAFERFQAKPWAERDIDVVLFGCLNERRISVLDALRRRGKNVVHLFDRYGAERNDVLARSKLSLNMLYYANGFFPSLRLLKCTPAGILSVCERAPEAPSWVSPPPVEYSAIVDRCMEILSLSPVAADDLADRARDNLLANPLRLPA